MLMKKRKLFTKLLCVISIFSIIYVLGGYAAGHIVFHTMFDKHAADLDKVKFEYKYLYKIADDYPSLSNPKEFYIEQNGFKLSSSLYEKENSKGLFILVHGLNSSSKSEFSMFTSYLLEKNYSVLTFALPGHGKSSGDILGFSNSVYALNTVINYANSNINIPNSNLNLLGYSLGAYAVTAVTNFNVNVNKVISFAGFNSSYEEVKESSLFKAGWIANLGLFTVKWALLNREKNDIYLSCINAIRNKKDSISYLVFQDEYDSVVPLSASTYGKLSENEINAKKVFLSKRDHHNLFFSDNALEKQLKIRNFYNQNIAPYGGIEKVGEEVRNYFLSLINKDQTSEMNLSIKESLNTFI